MFVLDSIRQYAGSGRIALVNREERLSFARLDARSEAFAAYLLARFGEDRTPVVIYGHKESDFLCCIYGALKAGRGYVPVDAVVPPERAAEIVEDVGPRLLVNFTGQALAGAGEVLDRAALEGILDAPPAEEVPRETWIAGDAPAYILFTSGSTGKPKGVPITVDNLTNFYHGLLPYMGEEEGGVILNQISYSFDVSGVSLYVGLSRGMTLYTVDKEMVEDLGSLFRHLEKSGLTMWVSTPSFAELCARSRAFCWESMPELERFLFCGEVLTHKLCDTLAERFPGVGVLNTYGPTEATVLVSAVWVTDDLRRDEKPIPIGYPLEEVELRIVDDRGEPVTGDSESGELLIISDSVGPGYHRRPEQTAKSFFLDEATGKRGYRTGDLACRWEGCYYYLGRLDNQLKLAGYRVELEDIENNLAQVEGISRAAVIPVYEAGEGRRVKYLAAFVLLEGEDGLASLQRTIRLKQRAAEFLPSYMIPRKLTVVDAFPLNTNGKIDRQALAGMLGETAKP